MSRIISFADGFTSVTAPTVAGGVQENYIIANNTVGGTLFTMDKTINKTAFIDYELIRKSDSEYHKQSGSLILAHDGTSWLLTEGNFQGESLINVTGVVDPQDLYLILDATTGALTYNSGNVPGTGYIGTFKLDIVRIA